MSIFFVGSCNVHVTHEQKPKGPIQPCPDMFFGNFSLQFEEKFGFTPLGKNDHKAPRLFESENAEAYELYDYSFVTNPCMSSEILKINRENKHLPIS